MMILVILNDEFLAVLWFIYLVTFWLTMGKVSIYHRQSEFDREASVNTFSTYVLLPFLLSMAARYHSKFNEYSFGR